MAEHTAGRIEVDEKWATMGVSSDNGVPVFASSFLSDRPLDACVANARRLVASWNVLERLGLSTNQIEDALVLPDAEFNDWLSFVLTNRHDAAPS